MIDSQRWGIIYSFHPGARKTQKRWEKIRRYMDQKGIQYDFVQTESRGSVERLARMLVENGYRTIVLVGGDASLNEALNGILGCEVVADDFAFGIIPNGIGNDFAHFWNKTPEEYKKSVDSVLERKVRKIDVGKCVYDDHDNIPIKRYFINCVNIGLGARLIEVANRFKSVIGSNRLSLWYAFFIQIFERKSFSMSINVNTEEISRNDIMSVCIGNCTGFGQTPNAVPYSQNLDLSVITRPEWWQLFEGFYLLGKGRFLNYKNVYAYRTKKIEIPEAGKAKISLDGLTLQEKNICNLRVSVEPERLNFIM